MCEKCPRQIILSWCLLRKRAQYNGYNIRSSCVSGHITINFHQMKINTWLCAFHIWLLDERSALYYSKRIFPVYFRNLGCSYTKYLYLDYLAKISRCLFITCTRGHRETRNFKVTVIKLKEMNFPVLLLKTKRK